VGARWSGGRLDEAVRAVALFLVAEAPVGETLLRIAVLLRDGLEPAMGVGLTLLDDQGRPGTAVFTDDFVPGVDRGQYEEGDGPCLAAFRERRVVRVDDTSAVADRWPRFAADALDHDVHSTLSLPLEAGGKAFGAMNIYAGKVEAFDEDDENDAALFVTQASAVLANARAYWTTADLASGLQEALRSRAVIEQAKGKIMATNRCDADEAFAILSKASQRENVKLRTIAQRIVEGANGRPLRSPGP
jgi:GAF domain-containing protein